jgi:hypothetical protein
MYFDSTRTKKLVAMTAQKHALQKWSLAQKGDASRKKQSYRDQFSSQEMR